MFRSGGLFQPWAPTPSSARTTPPTSFDTPREQEEEDRQVPTLCFTQSVLSNDELLLMMLTRWKSFPDLTRSLTNGTRAATRAGNPDGWRSHITTITTVINFIKSNIILLFAIFTTLEHVGGRHSFWSTGCTPCFPRQTPSSPGGSSARLPLGSPGRAETSQKWQLGARGWKS